jgi:hypothetical protein
VQNRNYFQVALWVFEKIVFFHFNMQANVTTSMTTSIRTRPRGSQHGDIIKNASDKYDVVTLMVNPVGN